MSAKVLLIGLDGLTAEVLDPLLESNRLPHFATLRDDGVYCPLTSTVPANSAPAWTSSRTGVNPGKHGVFSFWRYDAYRWTVAASTDILVPTIEQILSRRGFRVCGVNIPLSYPPQPVNGAFLSGLPTPAERRDYVYPQTLYHELRAMDIEFPVDGVDMLDTATPQTLIRQLARLHERRRAVTRYLLSREPWDLFWVVFTLADKLQHLAWRLKEERLAGDESHADLHPGSAIDACYQVLDETVGMLLQAIDDHTTILVVSDHGFGPCRTIFQPNLWLRSRDYLQLKTGHRFWVRSFRFDLSSSGRRRRPRVEVGPPHRRVRWGRTRAFSDLYVEPVGIRINIKDREPHGIVPIGKEADRVKRMLRDEFSTLLPSQQDTSPVFRLHDREDLYYGPFVDRAPDLILESSQSSTRFLGEFTHGEMIREPGPWPDVTGSHRPYGVFMGRGAGIDSGLHADEIRITDITPTILAVLGEWIPRYMEGRPLVA